MSAKRIVPVLAAMLVLLAGLAVVWALDRSEQERFAADRRALVTARLGSLRADLEAELNGRLYLASGLVSLTAHDPEITPEEFRRVARHLVQGHGTIRSVQLARDGVVTHVYPLAGNEAAVGLSLFDLPSQGEAARRAVAERRTVVAGPTPLVQGGEALISRTPIFLTDVHTGEEHFWGLATLLIDTDGLFRDAGLPRASEPSASGPGLRVAVRGRDGLGEAGENFFGDPSTLGPDPVRLEVTLPNGSWVLSASPAGGVDVPAPGTTFMRLAGLLLVLGLAIGAFFFVRNVFDLRLGLRAHWQAELALREQTRQLEHALFQVKTLTGLLPICSNCKQVRDDRGLWFRIERYIEEHSEATFTHGMCPTCVEELYGPDVARTMAARLDKPDEPAES